MSDDEAELLGQICANPDDDQPRMVYADLLLARGDKKRGEYIQITLEANRRHKAGLPPIPPEQSPFTWHERLELQRGWAAELGLDGFDHLLEWERGFPCKLSGSVARILECADAIARLPIVELSVGRPVRELAALAASTALTRIIRLSLGMEHRRTNRTYEPNAIPPRELEALGRSPNLGALRGLQFHDSTLTDDNADAVSALPWLDRLEQLAIHGGPGNDGLTRVLTSRLPRLRTLELSLLRLGVTGARVLTEHPLPAVEELVCRNLGIQSGYVDMFRAAGLARLRRLVISSDHATDAIASLRAVELRELRQLELVGNSIYDPGAAALAEVQGFSKLELLDLDDNHLTREGAVALARGSGLPALRVLKISRNPFPSGQTREVIRNEYEYDVAPGIEAIPIPFDDIKALFAHRPELRVD